MNTGDALLQAVIENPEDDTPRLVYADWLDETGGPEEADRAEFIRVQCRLTALADDSPERPELAKREKALLRRYAKRWAQPYRELIDWWLFRRGFIESAAVRTEGERATFAPKFRHLVESTPLRGLALFEQFVDARALLPAASHMTRLREFSVLHGHMHEEGPVIRTLLTSPPLAGLTKLELEANRNGSWFRPRPLCGILRSPVLGHLTDLRVAEYIWELHPTVLQAIIRSPSLTNLTRLCIESARFDQPNMRSLLRTSYASRLEVLALHHCQMDQAAWGELLADGVLPNLKCLMLGGAVIADIFPFKGEAADRLRRQAQDRFGRKTVDFKQTFPARPHYHSWW
jgi:uncharacterized protein (TIGR02996 family)